MDSLISQGPFKIFQMSCLLSGLRYVIASPALETDPLI